MAYGTVTDMDSHAEGMSDKNDRPAFPYTEYNQDGSLYNTERGMSLRDWFAGQALAGFCANQNAFPTEQWHFDALADDAYRMADATLAAREKGGGE